LGTPPKEARILSEKNCE